MKSGNIKYLYYFMLISSFIFSSPYVYASKVNATQERASQIQFTVEPGQSFSPPVTGLYQPRAYFHDGSKYKYPYNLQCSIGHTKIQGPAHGVESDMPLKKNQIYKIYASKNASIFATKYSDGYPEDFKVTFYLVEQH